MEREEGGGMGGKEKERGGGRKTVAQNRVERESQIDRLNVRGGREGVREGEGKGNREIVIAYRLSQFACR